MLWIRADGVFLTPTVLELMEKETRKGRFLRKKNKLKEKLSEVEHRKGEKMPEVLNGLQSILDQSSEC